MTQSMMGSNEEYAKWIIEPLVLCALDPTAFLRRESIKVWVEGSTRALRHTAIHLVQESTAIG